MAKCGLTLLLFRRALPYLSKFILTAMILQSLNFFSGSLPVELDKVTQKFSRPQQAARTSLFFWWFFNLNLLGAVHSKR